MINSTYEDDPSSDFYYIYYYDESYDIVTALSKIDEQNLKKIATDLKIDYIPMNKTANINYKLDDIRKQVANTQTKEEKISSYEDIYYYFAIPLVLLLLTDFVIKKRKMNQ